MRAAVLEETKMRSSWPETDGREIRVDIDVLTCERKEIK